VKMSFFGWNSKSKKEFESLSKQLEERIWAIQNSQTQNDLENRFNGYLQGHSAQLLGQVQKDNSAPLGYLNALKNRREYDVIGTFNINAYLVDRLFEFLRHETAKSAGVAVEGVKKEQIEQDIFDLVGSEIDSDQPVVLDLEAIRDRHRLPTRLTFRHGRGFGVDVASVIMF